MHFNDYRLYIMHHGIKGQEWGVKNGPPYPLSISEHSASENKAGWKKSLQQTSTKTSKKRSFDKDKLVKGLLIAGGAMLVGSAAYYALVTHGKKHISTVLRAGDRIHTLSTDPDRLKGANYIYESHKFVDKQVYKSKFNSVKDASGVIHLKKDITSKISKNMRIASEDDINSSFRELFKNDADFRKFVTTADYNVIKKQSKTAYNYMDGIKLANRIRSGKMDINKLTDRDINKLSKVFNYIIGDRSKPELETNKMKMFNHLKGRGFSGLIDINDSLYGGYKTRQSNIIFDMSSVVQENVSDISINDIRFAKLVDSGRYVLPSIGIGSIVTAGIIHTTDKEKK